MIAINALFETPTGFCCLTLLALLGRALALLFVCTRFFDLVRFLLFSSIPSNHGKAGVYVIRFMSYLFWEIWVISYDYVRWHLIQIRSSRYKQRQT